MTTLKKNHFKFSPLMFKIYYLKFIDKTLIPKLIIKKSNKIKKILKNHRK